MKIVGTEGITLGLVLPPCDEPTRLYAAIRLAEEHQFHSVWVTDATLPGYPWLESLSVLGGVVALTTRVQVGTSIFVPARRNPVLLAHTLASLDYPSNGRLIFGVGVSEKYLRPQEYTIANVPMERRGQITDEYLQLFRRLWSESSVTHEGEFFQCSDITVEPKPSRPGGIPIWVGGHSDGALRRAARWGDAWMPTLITAEGIGERRLQLDEYAVEAGRDPSSISGATYIFASIGPSYEDARNVLAPAIEGIFRAPFAAFEPLCLLGTPDQWVEQIAHFTEAGIQHVNVLLFTTDILADVQQIGDEVIPRLAELGR
ncbi:MAG: LLM class flavin-dependent oxidoreductase [Chloroflexota bacterium]